MLAADVRLQTGHEEELLSSFELVNSELTMQEGAPPGLTRITMSNTLDTVYKALMALNNVGISLLRVGCHGEAKEAFSDALLIIHELLSVPAASPDEDLVSRTSITANIISKTQKLASIPNDENMQHIFNYTTIEPYECSDILRRCLADIFPIKAFLIRIESYTGSSRFPFGDYCPALESSIILYNCAIAHLHFHETRDMVHQSVHFFRY